ncbi:hypothetical protein H0H92_006719, partial [Tricholoma furcatifolium]
MSFPQAGTFYRIRSVDFSTCLQLWDIHKERVVLRPLEEKDLQLWLFIKESGPGDRYKIMAAASATQSSNYLAITSPGDASQTRPPAPPTLVDDARASIWQIVKDEDDAYVLTTNGNAQRSLGKVQRHEAFLTVSEAGMLDSIKKRASNPPVTTPSERWQITEYWPSIPQNTNPNLNKLAVEALRADYHQKARENDLLPADGPQDLDKNPAASGNLFSSQDHNDYVMTSHSRDLSHPGPSFLATESENYNNKVPYNEHELPTTQPNTTFNQLEAVNHFLMNMPWMADPEVSMDVTALPPAWLSADKLLDESVGDNDSDAETVIDNEEPEPTNTLRLLTKTKPTKPSKKRKRRSTTHTKSKSNIIDVFESEGRPSQKQRITVNNGDSQEAPAQPLGRKRNPVYLFYEQLDHGPNHEPLGSDTYYRCFHGSKKIIKVTKQGKHTTGGLINHLKTSVPSMYRLYMHLYGRATPPTAMEIDIAAGRVKFSIQEANNYIVDAPHHQAKLAN